MRVWQLDRLQDKIKELQTQTPNYTRENYYQYVLSPFLMSLSYDIFSPREVSYSRGVVKLVVGENVEAEITLGNYTSPPEDGSNVKIHLDIDTKQSILTLSLLALGKWEVVEQLSVMDKLTPEQEEKYTSIVYFLDKENVLSNYDEFGDRIFTEGVLLQLMRGKEIDNRFLRQVVRTEIENPQSDFYDLLATRLEERYTIQGGIGKYFNPSMNYNLRELFINALGDEAVIDNEVPPLQPPREPVVPEPVSEPREEQQVEQPQYEEEVYVDDATSHVEEEDELVDDEPSAEMSEGTDESVEEDEYPNEPTYDWETPDANIGDRSSEETTLDDLLGGNSTSPSEESQSSLHDLLGGSNTEEDREVALSDLLGIPQKDEQAEEISLVPTEQVDEPPVAPKPGGGPKEPKISTKPPTIIKSKPTVNPRQSELEYDTSKYSEDGYGNIVDEDGFIVNIEDIVDVPENKRVPVKGKKLSASEVDKNLKEKEKVNRGKRNSRFNPNKARLPKLP